MKIYTDSLHRIAYSTDASIYREVPIGVAYPETTSEIVELLAEARRRKTCVIPRAGGTSIAGQVVGKGIVVDVSRHLNRIVEINADERWARVQPGVIRDDLNAALRPYGLFFSPETSTSNRCCIGGMFGNNSCGTHSLVYGSTRDHILEVKAILSDGSEEIFRDCTVSELEKRFGRRFWEKEQSGLSASIYARMIKWGLNENVRAEIDANFPDSRIRRRSCGYALDEALQDLPDRIDVCRLLSGSEGTLAFVTELKISLDPIPSPHKVLVCSHFDSIEKSLTANLKALEMPCVAVELIDGEILRLCKDNPSQQENRFFVQGNPEALLITEFCGDDADADAEALSSVMQSSGACVSTFVRDSDSDKVWALRKAGLGVLTSRPDCAKPVGVVEDTAVAPDVLPQYIAEFRSMMRELGLNCVYYGHIGTGELHLRPQIDIKSEEGRVLFRAVAERTCALVKKYRGSLSGEHGDGRLRGEFIPVMYGSEVYSLMCDTKHLFDPDGVFNAGKIVEAPRMDVSLRYLADSSCAAPDASELLAMAEQCNGSGDCRKTNVSGGTMCPTYKVSSDELMSTRARSNILREILTRGWNSEVFKNAGSGADIFSIPELGEVLDTCISCKGCRRECPSSVDMAWLKSNVLQRRYDSSGTPMRAFAVSRMADIERIGHVFRPIYNYFATGRLSSLILKKILHFAVERDIPSLSRKTMRQMVRKQCCGGSGRKVYLFADEFTDLQEAETGLHFALLLQKLGYCVEIPEHRESGRAAISKGCMHHAARLAEANVRSLCDIISDDAPLVGIEPSCILSFRDEYPRLVKPELSEKARELSRNCLLFDEFIVREMQEGRIKPESFRADRVEIWLHGHCHQKSLIGTGKTEKMLGLLRGAKVNVIPDGCCGMAGSFGYETEHYRTSIAIGEMILFPKVREVVAKQGIPVMIAAPGISCRQQIFDGTGVRAVHPVEILYSMLDCHNDKH